MANLVNSWDFKLPWSCILPVLVKKLKFDIASSPVFLLEIPLTLPTEITNIMAQMLVKFKTD